VCVCGGGQAPIAVTPRSSQSPSAGFNAGMFVFNPSRATFQGILNKFLGLTEQQMLATSEQDFLNEFFACAAHLPPPTSLSYRGCTHSRIVIMLSVRAVGGTTWCLSTLCASTAAS
jgi:hypothetical protein